MPPDSMTKVALEVVEEYRVEKGLPGTLEALQAMQADPHLTPNERYGFNVAFDGFRRLFHGDD